MIKVKQGKSQSTQVGFLGYSERERCEGRGEVEFRIDAYEKTYKMQWVERNRLEVNAFGRSK